VSRPAVSVVVPFLGDAVEAEALLARLASLETAPGDELIVADNTPAGIVAPLAAGRANIVEVADARSASHARNAGAGRASGEWLLFIDADCEPPPDLIEAYFRDPVGDRCGIVAGEIEGAPEQSAFLARWARSRRGHWVAHHLSWGPHPAGVTANLLVRRSAFEALDGFRIGGGGDLDLCWRAQEQGWEFAYRPEVVVRHRDRERLAELADQAIAYGGHQRHLRDLHGPGVPSPRPLAPLARSLGGAAVWTFRGRFEQARFKLVDGFWTTLEWWGWLSRGARARKAD
jgi:GT2 family glycosyltransferase